jgi:L,D-transpeptidase YcbB
MKQICVAFLSGYMLLAINLPAQLSPGKIREFILADDSLKSADIQYRNEVKTYYAALDYHTSWLQGAGSTNREALLDLLKNAGRRALNEQDYQYESIQRFRSEPAFLKNVHDSLIAEIKFSDAAIHFFNDLMYGNRKPRFSHEGLNYTPDCYNIPLLLAECVRKNNVCILETQEPSIAEIKQLSKKIIQLEDLLLTTPYTEQKVILTSVTRFNKPLLKKLYYLGISDSLDIQSDIEVKEKLKEAQRQFGLTADGTLRSATLQELNVSIDIRLQQLKLAINYYRWLFCLTNRQPVVVVNIPAAYMKVYDRTGTILEMRMIVGKPSTPTPTLCSRINEVALYPYWMVPRNIATRELLPSIKKDISFINVNSFQIINNQGKVVDPASINWQALTVSNFPYTIRQSTGCDNALGLIKLNFYNPFNVYLHDTPGKSLFSLSKRYFSHGCMRMEKPMELGRLVLKNNTIAIDSLEEKGCIRSQRPIIIPADEKMPVIVWYNPVGTDSTGRVLFYEDRYKRFTWKRDPAF